MAVGGDTATTASAMGSIMPEAAFAGGFNHAGGFGHMGGFGYMGGFGGGAAMR